MNAMTPEQREEAARRGYAQRQEQPWQSEERARLTAQLDREILRVLDLATEEVWATANLITYEKEVRGKIFPTTTWRSVEEFHLRISPIPTLFPRDTSTNYFSLEGELWHYFCKYASSVEMCPVRHEANSFIESAIRELQCIQSVNDFPSLRR